jgi:hypothetical protein
MSLTFIKTGNCPRQSVSGAGASAEILNESLCGAKNVLAKLHWLKGDDKFQADAKTGTHELIYLMEGDAVINLSQKDYPVTKGAGIYLGPNEAAAIRPGGQGEIKLLQLIVPETKD